MTIFNGETSRSDYAQGKASGAYPWAVVGVLWFVYFLNQADRQVVFSVFPLIKGEMQLSDTQLGAIGSVFFWVYAVLVPFAGALGDSFSRRWIIVGSLALWSAATLCSSFATGLVSLAILGAFTAAGEAFYYPSAASLISDYHAEQTRATALSVHQTAVYLGVIVSGGLAGYVGQHYGWRSTFVAFGAAGVAVALVVFRFVREPQRSRSTPVSRRLPASRLREVLRSPSIALHATAFLCMLVALTAYLAWTPMLLYRKFGMSLESAGLNATLWHHLGAMGGTMLGGRLADRWAIRDIVMRPAIQAVGMFCGVPFIFLMGWLDTQTLVLASLAIFGFCRGIYDSNLFASPYEVVSHDARATATGVILAIGFLGGGVGPLFVGRLSQHWNLGAALSTTCAFYLLGGILLSIDCAFFFRRSILRMTQEYP